MNDTIPIDKNHALLTIPDRVFWIGPQGTCVDLKAAVDSDPRSAVPKSIAELWPPVIAQQMLELTERALRTGVTETLEYELSQGAERRYLEARINGCSPNGALVLVRDITERRLAEARLVDSLVQLEKSHADLLSILGQLRLVSVLLDEWGKITFLSQTCLRILGKDQEQLVGRPWTEICPFADAEKARLQEILQRSQQDRIRISAHLDSASGRRYWLEIDVRDDPRDPRCRMIFLYDQSEVHDLRRLLNERTPFHRMIGNSKPMLRVYREIRVLAQVDTTVLIEGETGTGKELVAREIHAKSRRKGGPFIPLNCAGLSESLLASQLFGHSRGAFTGAIADHQGVFESADGGTLFLDEIGDMPLAVQTSLLRVLEEHEITRLGESKPRKVDVRILAATHHDLQDAAVKGAFRADLLFRIRVARIHLPPLREHLDDLPLLVNAFLAHCRAVIGKPVEAVSPETLTLLQAYPWPGNIRELKSAIEFAVIRCRGLIIQPDDLPPEISNPPLSLSPTLILPTDEKRRLLAALKQTGGNRTAAAHLLGMSRATFYRRLAQYGILRDFH